MSTTSEFGGGQGTIPPAAPRTTEPEAPLISSYLHIAADGTVTVFTGKAEVGQNIRTSLGQAVADELRLPLSAIRLVMADTARTSFDRGTFGSRTTPDMASQLRRAAASAREALLALAADRWESDRGALIIQDGKVIHAETGQALHFGDLTGGHPLTQPVDVNALTIPANQWTATGISAPKVDAHGMVTGAHRYASDVTRPGMLHARVLRPPAFGATLVSVDTTGAEGMPGVTVVRDGDFVGVAAPHARTAVKAVEAIRAAWTCPPQPSEGDLFTMLKAEPGETDGGRGLAERARFNTGSMEEGLAAADHTLAMSYTLPYIAHAPLEPRAALVEWDGEAVTVWTGTQRPFGVQAELMAIFGLPASQVRVVVPDTGSGYGGKHTGEAALEAARLARATGTPVKVAWTREEEFTWAYFRPAGVIEVTAGAGADGTLTAWEFHNYNSGAGSIRTPYEVPHQRIEFHPARSPLRQGSYRALAATANTFARESCMDELACVAGIDPLAFRLKNLRDTRLRAVLEAVAERIGWSSRGSIDPAEGRAEPGKLGVGLACGTEKGGYVATCAQVSIDTTSRQITIVRVVAAFECGAAVNPDHLRSQIEGAIVQGTGGALFEAIRFAGGKILNPRFSQYRVPRFGDVPPIETVILNRKDLPSAGAGETPIIAIAPAVANAIFAATGIRLRSLPLTLPPPSA